MRFTHYMQYFVDLENGKLIPVSVFFWRPMCNFSRGVLKTIYSIWWWWWSAWRVCPYSIFDLQIWNLGRGFLLRLFCSEPLFDKIWWYFRSWDQRLLSSLRRGKSSTKDVHRLIQPGRAPTSPGEQREHRPSASEPRAEHYTPNTRSPAFAASYW